MTKTWFASDLHYGHRAITAFSPSRVDVLGLPFRKEDIADAYKTMKDKTVMRDKSQAAKYFMAQVTDKMNAALIEQWNDTVGFSDEVYILGDVSFAPIDLTAKFLDEIHGRLFLVRGNHDYKTDELERWEWVKDYHSMKVQGQDVVLFHYPIWEWDKMHYGSFQLFGHIHGKDHPIGGRCLDVSMESTGKVTISWEEVYATLIKREIRTHHDAEREQID